MSLPPQPQPPAPPAVTGATAPVVTSTTAVTGPTGSRRGRRRRIAIDVETERAKLQALLSHSLHNPSILSHLPRGANMRVQRESLQNPSDAENVSPGPGRPRHKFQPPPAHQHPPPSAASLLRSSHQQQNQTSLQQQHGSQSRRETSHERASRRAAAAAADENQSEPTNFSTRSQQSTLDLSVKSGNLSSAVAAAAMNALSSLSSVTVTPVTLGSPPVHGGNSNSNSAPMDLSAR